MPLSTSVMAAFNLAQHSVLVLAANPTPLAVRSKERAAIADDLAVFVLTRHYRPRPFPRCFFFAIY